MLVDGSEVAENDYDLTEGSAIISLRPSFLKTLSAGKHNLTVEFDDGSLETTFTIAVPGQSGGSNSAYRIPVTGIE